MTQTYTSGEISVSRGDITGHDTASVAEDISILDARARWQGVTITEETGETVTKENTSSFSVTESDTGVTKTASFPGPTYFWDSATLIEHATRTFLDSGAGTIEFDFTIYDNSGSVFATGSGSSSKASGGSEVNEFWTEYDTRLDSGGEIEFTITNVQADQAPIGGYVGALSSFAETTTKQTTDPAATRDVDASYTGTLSDGEWSPWVSMGGVEQGVNEIYHNLSGSEEAVFQFEYDWEYIYPTPAKQLRIGSRDGSKIHKVSVTDTNSDRLDYNHIRTTVNGNVYAIDVVDPSDPNALDWVRIGTPNHGIVCPRVYETIDNS